MNSFSVLEDSIAIAEINEYNETVPASVRSQIKAHNFLVPDYGETPDFHEYDEDGVLCDSEETHLYVSIQGRCGEEYPLVTGSWEEGKGWSLWGQSQRVERFFGADGNTLQEALNELKSASCGW